jgi:hypothetical protein
MLSALRRSRAVAAFVLAALASGIVLATVHAVGLPTLPLGIGVVSGAAVVLLVEAWRRRRRATRATLRGHRRAVPKAPPGRHYDLAKDRSTDSQRWLM